MNIAIILAGGKGTRMMRDVPKQFISINGKPLIVHTLEKFSDCQEVDQVIVVCIKSYIKQMKEICKMFNINKVVDIIEGGKNRHQSIKKSIQYLNEKNMKDNDKLIIHNANMPLVSKKNIINCINLCQNDKEIITSVAKNTGYFYKYDVNQGTVSIGPDRNEILSAKVPECLFLSTAYHLYCSSKYNDSIYESYTAGMLGLIENIRVVPTYCETTNIKITTEDDYKLVKTFLSSRNDGNF